MLSRIDFLSLVLPPKGYYCVMGLKDGASPKQLFTETIENLSDLADALVHEQRNAYFALASFADDDEGRTNANALDLRSFFVDIDCGLGKPYADQTEGLTALKKFTKDASFPRPTVVVNSGRGIHAYWALEQQILKTEWKPLAEAFKALCAQHKFMADPAVTADVSRILRVPETLNFKDIDSPIPTSVLMVGKCIPIADFKQLLGPIALEIPGEKPFTRQMDPLTLALMGNYESKFKTILVKSVNGEGCNQIKNIYENQATIEEPLWRAGLSIASHCADRDKAIHIISKKHPDYSESVTQRKAGETKGPYTCATFKKLNPEGCEGCPLKITSPIQIGREVKEAEGPVEVQSVESVTKEERTYTIPQYPFPFFRGNVGGVYRKADPDKEDEKDELVYPYDYYIVMRIHDPEDGEMILARLHLPKDGVREFVLPLSAVTSKERFITAIASQGMAVLGKKQELMMQYTAKWVEQLQSTEKSLKARRQFGWLDDESAFIVGDREIKADGTVEYSPPTAQTLPVVPMFSTKGDFHVWKDVINAYARPNMELRAFAFFMGFGGPLMKFVAKGALDGFLLNLVSRGGGTGKSTLLHAINSIYGRPKELMLSYKDTHNHRLQRLGTMQSMTPTIDELTDMEPKAMGHLVYDITSGKGKNRMSGKANVERINTVSWSIPVVSSSNRRIKDALLSIKSFPEPELLRILEDDLLIDTNTDDAIWSKAHFGRLLENYGHAIDPYIKYVATNLPEVKAMLDKVNERIDRSANIKPNERFWSAGAAIALTGGTIAKNLGLHDIDLKPVYKYAVDLINRTRVGNKESLGDTGDYLGTFLQRHFHEILVINGNKDKRTGLEQGAFREPRGQLSARYEPDTRLLFIVTNVYRDDCGKQFVGMEDTLLPHRKSGAYLGIKKKRMLAGTLAGAAAGVPALVFDTSKLEFFNEEVFVNADRDGTADQD